MTPEVKKLVEQMKEAAGKATPDEWEAIKDHGFLFIRTVDRIVKNDPGNFPPDYHQDILGDEDYDTKEGDIDWIDLSQPKNVLTLIAALEAAVEREKGIQEALDRYHQALVDREHGGLAAAKLVEGLEAEFNTSLDDYRDRQALETKL